MSSHPSWKISSQMSSSWLGLLGENYHMYQMYQVLKFFKYFSIKEAVRSLRALYWSNPASTHPCPWPRSSTSAQPGAVRPFPNKAIGVKSPTLSLTPCPSAPGWMPWMIPGPAPCLGVLGAANRPCGTGTTEEEWDSVGSCSAPQPQQCRSIQILWHFPERTTRIVLKCWRVVNNIRLVFQAFLRTQSFFPKQKHLPFPRPFPGLCPLFVL